MSEYHFGVVQYFKINPATVEKIDEIAHKHGCSFVQIRDPHWKAWFSGPNRGSPFDRDMADAVMADVRAAGYAKIFDR